MNEKLFGMRPSVSLDDNLRGSLAGRDLKPMNPVMRSVKGEEARVCNLVVNEFNMRKVKNARMQAEVCEVQYAKFSME